MKGAGRGRRERAQVVLVAAALLAVALVPMAIAVGTLGYHDDVAAGRSTQPPGANAVRLLERAVHEAAGDVDGRHWQARAGAAAAANRSLESALRTLETARLEEGVAVSVTRNATAARAWAGANCPSGPNGQFGGCETLGGLVLQERAGEVTLLAVGFDVRVTEPRGVTELTVVAGAV